MYVSNNNTNSKSIQKSLITSIHYSLYTYRGFFFKLNVPIIYIHKMINKTIFNRNL